MFNEGLYQVPKITKKIGKNMKIEVKVGLN